MKVAIIGAGLSGLSCAYELQKLGIKPVIFEKKGYIGDALGYTKISFRLFDRPMTHTGKFVRKNYGIDIKPLCKLKEITMAGPSRKTVIKGNLGYIYKKGLEEYSLERQIASSLEVPVVFDTLARLEDLKKEFDFIVAATGEESIAKQLGVWTPTFNTMVRIVIVIGKFKEGSIQFWLNTEFAKNGYAYLIPNNSKEGCFTLVINHISGREIDYYFNRFLDMSEFPYKIIDTRDYEFSAGLAYPLNVGNVYLAGNSAGFVDEFLGLGMANSIESGALAARSIVKGLDYTEQARHIIETKKKIYEFRKAANTLENDDYDRIITILRLPLIKQFIYNNPFIRATDFSFLFKAVNKIKKI